MGQLGLEGVGVLGAGEVAAVAAPGGDRAGDPARSSASRSSRARASRAAAEVLLGDDVGRVLRPALRELDAALLERGVLRVADDRVAKLPLDLVEGVDAGGREAALDDQPGLAGRASFAAVLLIKSSPSRQLSGVTPNPRARPGQNARGPGGPESADAGAGRVPRNCRYAPRSRSQAREAELPDALRLQGPGVRRRRLDAVDDRLDVGRGNRALVGGREERAAELRPIEALALPIALDHMASSGSRRSNVVNRRPHAGALPAAADRVAVRGAPALEDASGGTAGGANHATYSTSGSGFLLSTRHYM